MTAQEWIAVTLGVLACVTDISTRRIPNVLTFPAAGAGLAFYFVTTGMAGGAFALSGLALGLALFLPFFLLGGLGAGDVKLLAALGAWLGPTAIFWTGIYGMIAGGLLAIVIAVAAGYVGQLLRNLWLLLVHWRVSGLRRLDSLTLEHGTGPKLAYALPITIGVVCSLWWH